MTAVAVRAARWIRWYLREYSGDGAYERHVARHRVERPDTPVPTRREYERHLARHRDRHPASRCC